MARIRLWVFLVIGVALLLAVESKPAQADASCTALLASKWQQVNKFNPSQPGNARYTIELTMHRENVNFVTYSHGYLAPLSGGFFSGDANQLFSDRGVTPQSIPVGQPFNINAADQLKLNLSPTGVLKIHYSPWNFDTAWDLSCKGSVLTTYLPNFGVVTLTFRNLFSPF